MRLLLVSANRERTPYPVFPIGLAYLTGPLSAAGHCLRILDLCFAEDPVQEMVTALDDFTADCVIVSIRNIDNVTWPESRSYLEGVRDAVTPCRGRAAVVLGGSGFSLMPREVLEFVGGDFGVVGEGEEVLPDLIARLERGEGHHGLPGVLARGEESFVPPRRTAVIGVPDRRLFDLGRYRREGGMANVQTKRGCPFACVYCTYPMLEGQRMRLRPIPEIITELRQLQADDIDYVYFVDDIFNYPVGFATDLCRSMQRERLGINWSAFINPAFLTESLLSEMIGAGCDGLEFGTDSGSAEMLIRLGKCFGVDDIRAASRMCSAQGVDFAHYLVFGGPGETVATIHESFTLMDELEPTAVIAMTGLRIFPGTPLHRQAVEEGMIDPEATLLSPVFYLSPAVADLLAPIVTELAMQRKNWIVPGLEINMSDSMMEALRHFPVRGPLWKLMKRLGRARVKPLSA